MKYQKSNIEMQKYDEKFIDNYPSRQGFRNFHILYFIFNFLIVKPRAKWQRRGNGGNGRFFAGVFQPLSLAGHQDGIGQYFGICNLIFGDY